MPNNLLLIMATFIATENNYTLGIINKNSPINFIEKS